MVWTNKKTVSGLIWTNERSPCSPLLWMLLLHLQTGHQLTVHMRQETVDGVETNKVKSGLRSVTVSAGSSSSSHLTISACFRGQLDWLTAATTNTVNTGRNMIIAPTLHLG